MAKFCITGCAGFIGSWICDKILAAGHEVIGIDNLSSGINYTPNNIEFHKVDVATDNLVDILKNADAIVHAAAYAELRHNWEDISERDKLFLNNEIATRKILEQMPDVPIIFLSTAAVYGSTSQFRNHDKPLIEIDAGSDTVESPYAASKLACESYVAAWSHKRKTPWYNLRLVNQVGARTHRGVITDFLRKIKDGKHIHAADNGKQVKNWVNVEDTANTVVRLLDKNNPVPSGIYTVTSEERWSWKNIVDIMLKMHEEKYPGSEKPFTLSWEERLAGSIGDPINLYVSGEKLKPYYDCNSSVEKAVREALTYLGWCK